MKLDTRPLRKAVRRFADETRRDRDKLMRQAAKGFVRTIISITPPGSSQRTGKAAQAAGSFLIQVDVLKLVYAATAVGRSGRKALATPSDLLAVHTASRNQNTGRVNPRNRAKLLMSISDINRVIAQLQLNVGFLAAGWNKAARYLGVSVPHWISRHGDSFGVVKATITTTRFHLEISDTVPFIGHVDGMDSRMERAMTIEIGNLRRQAGAILRQAAKSSGFH